MRIENIMFWILIALIAGTAIWKLFGSPTDTAALISIALFMAGSEILLWKTFFAMDKKVSIGFIKMKNDLDNKLRKIDNKLENIENSVRRSR